MAGVRAIQKEKTRRAIWFSSAYDKLFFIR